MRHLKNLVIAGIEQRRISQNSCSCRRKILVGNAENGERLIGQAFVKAGEKPVLCFCLNREVRDERDVPSTQTFAFEICTVPR